jgi:2-iminobutanoate/2-iminopropanoate deaminase
MRRLPSLALALLLVPGCATPRVDHLPAEGAIGPYSAAVDSGSLVFLSGKIGKTGKTLADDTRAAIDAIEKDLRSLGLGLGDVVAVQVFLTDMAAYAELNTAYAERFPKPYPARTTVGVSALPGGARVEIQATALRRKR